MDEGNYFPLPLGCVSSSRCPLMQHHFQFHPMKTTSPRQTRNQEFEGVGTSMSSAPTEPVNLLVFRSITRDVRPSTLTPSLNTPPPRIHYRDSGGNHDNEPLMPDAATSGPQEFARFSHAGPRGEGPEGADRPRGPSRRAAHLWIGQVAGTGDGGPL